MSIFLRSIWWHEQRWTNWVATDQGWGDWLDEARVDEGAAGQQSRGHGPGEGDPWQGESYHLPQQTVNNQTEGKWLPQKTQQKGNQR